MGNNSHPTISRRDFLKLMAATGAAIGFAPFVNWSKFFVLPNSNNVEEASATASFAGQDRFGINKIYADAPNNSDQNWFMSSIRDPSDDPRVRISPDANMIRHSDGSWTVRRPNDNYAIRFGVWSISGSRKWVNVEITVYSKFMSIAEPGTTSTRYVLHLYTRGGSHNNTNRCEGSAYKGRIRTSDGAISFTKEIQHGDYTSNRQPPNTSSLTLTKPYQGNYIGSKFIVYNLPESPTTGRIPVKLEYWVDEDGMTRDGVFNRDRQNWRKFAQTTDTGGWSSGDGGGCPPIEIGNTGDRKPDEILNRGGGLSTGNAIWYRTDDIVSRIKYFSGRVIIPP